MLGTLSFFIWPVVVPAIFPGLVESGVIAGSLDYWASILFALSLIVFIGVFYLFS